MKPAPTPVNSKIMHGDAWAAFAKEAQREKITSAQYVDELWPWFLKGWLAKAKQHDQLRNMK